jgi:hypothetical protein
MEPYYPKYPILFRVYGCLHLRPEQIVAALDTALCAGCKKRGKATLSPEDPIGGMIYAAVCDCGKKWYICSHCRSKPDSPQSHLKAVHNVKGPPDPASTSLNTIQPSASVAQLRSSLSTAHTQAPTCKRPPTASMSSVGPIKRPKSVVYLQRSMEGPLANQLLVASAFKLSHKPNSAASPEETAFHLKTAKFVISTARGPNGTITEGGHHV